MEMDIGIVPYRVFENNADYLNFSASVNKEGTVSRELNQILCYAIDMAEKQGFKPSPERGLGDFAFDDLGLSDLGSFVRAILNASGPIYINDGVYPILYTCDDECMPIVITMEELRKHNEKE